MTPRSALVTRSAALRKVLRGRDALTARELCDELGWTRSTLRDVLDAMVAAGAVRRTKESARDPGQKYTLVAERP